MVLELKKYSYGILFFINAPYLINSYLTLLQTSLATTTTVLQESVAIRTLANRSLLFIAGDYELIVQLFSFYLRIKTTATKVNKLSWELIFIKSMRNWLTPRVFKSMINDMLVDFKVTVPTQAEFINKIFIRPVINLFSSTLQNIKYYTTLFNSIQNIAPLAVLFTVSSINKLLFNGLSYQKLYSLLIHNFYIKINP